MSLQEKYQPLIDLANQSNISNLNISEGEGFIKIEGSAPSAEVKQSLMDKWNEIDPEYRSGDMVVAVTAPEAENAGTTYTVQSGDSLSKIGAHHGVSWKAIFDANLDKLDDPDKIQPGQELTIPAA